MWKSAWIKWIAIGGWLAYWLYTTRYAMLDDALIHLRYAAFLHDLHFITYDGVNATYGTSSLLYVSLLALLRGLTFSPMLPKIVSCVCYVLLVALLLSLETRFARRKGPYVLWLGLLLATLTPMAVRWLTDGMETSMVVLATVVLVLVTARQIHRESTSPLFYCTQVLLGLVIVLLRVELASLACIAVCAILAGHIDVPQWKSRKFKLLLLSSPLALGAILGLIAIRVIFGSILPDTALAKSGPPSVAPLLGVGHAILSSILFGVSATLLTAISGALLLWALLRERDNTGMRWAWICVNACFPLIVVLSCLHGQAIQGVRYVLWPLFFTTVWNALEWERLRSHQTAVQADVRFLLRLSWTCAVIFICLLPLDWYFAARAMLGRADTFLAMRSAGLSRYRTGEVIAGDVGFIGYFSGATVCDLAGLVNGRERAKWTFEERARWCAAQHPQLLFLTGTQQQRAAQFMDLSKWVTIKQVDFRNVGGSDRHYLMVPLAR